MIKAHDLNPWQFIYPKLNFHWQHQKPNLRWHYLKPNFHWQHQIPILIGNIKNPTYVGTI